jgi:cob(I)alamin adenosyltransferase
VDLVDHIVLCVLALRQRGASKRMGHLAYFAWLGHASGGAAMTSCEALVHRVERGYIAVSREERVTLSAESLSFQNH